MTLAVNNITNEAGSGGPTLPNGMTVGTAPMPAVTGTAPIYACRAWVNFNGTGTVAIRASGNVSSITDNGVGDYTVNFTTAMPDANYAAVVSGTFGTNGTQITYAANTQNNTTTSCRVIQQASAGGGGGSSDSVVMNVAIFR